jgi:hypothetical protein
MSVLVVLIFRLTQTGKNPWNSDENWIRGIPKWPNISAIFRWTRKRISQVVWIQMISQSFS